MHLDQLETLVALIDEGTFDAAARRLHVTASAVSQRVKAMEQAAGQVLVRRTSPVSNRGGRRSCSALGARWPCSRPTRTELRSWAGTRGSPTAPAARRPMAIAVNADSLATWFLGRWRGSAASEASPSTCIGRTRSTRRAAARRHRHGRGHLDARGGAGLLASRSGPCATGRCVRRVPRVAGRGGLAGSSAGLALGPRRPLRPGRRSAGGVPPRETRTAGRGGAAPDPHVGRLRPGGRAGFRLGLLPEQQCLSPLAAGSPRRARPGVTARRGALLAALEPAVGAARRRVGGRPSAGCRVAPPRPL